MRMRIRMQLVGSAAALGAALLHPDPSFAFRRAYPSEQVPVVRHLDAPTPFSQCIWVGYAAGSADPNKVGVGGVWDWDTNIAFTDSAQFWSFVRADWRFENVEVPAPASRPTWHLDHGNEINLGNTNLWAARGLAGRAYRRPGIASAWHRDDFGPSVPAGVLMPGGPAPLIGAFSAWCGLRSSGDVRFRDELTNNGINGDLAYQWRIGSDIQSAWPGYGDQWDQLLYRDFPGGAGPLTFTMSCDMSTELDGAANGSGWFTKDPTSPANYENMLPDVFRVWVGVPKEVGVFDTNHRYLSEVIDFVAPAPAPVLLFSAGGFVAPAVIGPLAIPALGPTVRIVFEVKTNRVGSDEVTGPAPAFNSANGAVVLDNVFVGATLSDFEASGTIRPRAVVSAAGVVTGVNPATTWIATGRPVGPYGHIHNSGDLPYADPCGDIGSPERKCALTGNVLVQSNHDGIGHAHASETWNQAVSPTIKLHPGNPQGIPPLVPGPTRAVLAYDFYPGFMGPEQGTFWEIGVRYKASTLSQPQGDPGAAWSGFNMADYIQYIPSANCFTDTVDLSALFPLAADSIQISLGVVTRCTRFAAVACGQNDGAYFDNVRFGLVTDLQPTLASSQFWSQLQDAFPGDEGVAPGTALFDRLTADLQSGVSNSSSDPALGDGVMLADAGVYFAPEFEPIRLDFVFRILPGPGNYSIKGDKTSPLLWDPAVPLGPVSMPGDGSFWGEYIASNGDPALAYIPGPNGHGVASFPLLPGYWDPHTWNSARMDHVNVNLWPIASRGISGDRRDYWQTTMHPVEPKLPALGDAHAMCFLVDPAGPADKTNICCSAPECAGAPWFSAYPPAWAAGAPVATTRGTEILPDDLFTPGTHIEYYVRRSLVADPTSGVVRTPDPTLVTPQSDPANLDQERWSNVDVLPDNWKNVAFGGSGLACLLWVDAADRRGEQAAVVRTMNFLGYGSNDGASRGWRQLVMTDPFPDPNDPAGFVSQNLGHGGLAYDRFDIQGAESFGGGRPGCRFAAGVDPANLAFQCKAGPSLAMLDAYYPVVFWSAGDNDQGALHDGVSRAEQSDDVSLILNWLTLSDAGHPKALWTSGDGIARDLANSFGLASDLLDHMGAVFLDDSYFAMSANSVDPAIFKPLDAHPGAPDPFHSSRRYGIANSCTFQLDIVDRNGGILGAERAARYEQLADRGNGLAGPFYSSVYRRADPGVGRFFATLLDGFALSHLLAWGGPSDPMTAGALGANDYGRMAWADDALLAFNMCARLLPVIAVGDVPGIGGLNVVRGAFPNPARSATATVEFTLGESAKATIRIYDVAGRLIHEGSMDGVKGLNRYRWDGRTMSGRTVASGTYFYRLSAPGVSFANNSQRIIFLR